MTSPLSMTDQIVAGASQLGGLAVLSATLAGIVALSYRWVTRERVPLELALLAGLASVSVYLNTTTVLGQIIEGEMGTAEAALFNVGAFLLGGAGAVAGHRIGDTFGRDVLNDGEREAVDEEVSRLVRTVGRVTVVDVPEDVADVVGYDPISERTREQIAGSQFVFPRNLTVSELDSRIRSRLKTDYGVGTVDLELDDDGTIEHLAVGTRAAGIGPTLPPATNAVALRADPAFAASTGDVVQVWETDPMRRVLTGELRGVAGDVVTVAINSADTPKVDPTRTYRLVTLPVDDRPAREFASLLRAADESYTSLTVEAGSPLHGMPVGALDVTVVAVEPEDEEPVTLPPREYVLGPGETVFAIAVPDALRKLEGAANPLDPALVADTGRRTTEVRSELAAEADAQDHMDSAGPQEVDGAAEPPESAPTPDSPSGPPEAEGEPGGVREDEPVASQADATSFERLKAEHDAGEDWDEEDSDDTEPPVEHLADSSETTDIDAEQVSDSSGGTSFNDLKTEFESGEADWDETDSPEESVDEDPLSPDDEGGSDDLMSLDEAEITIEDKEETVEEGSDSVDSVDGGFDGLDEGFDETEDVSSEDDLTSLSLDDADGETLFEDDSFADDSLEDDGLFEDDGFGDDDTLDDGFGEEDDEEATDGTDEDESEDDESEDEDDADEDSDDSSDDSGGGSTFAQLKEEFESGDADWEDDISDSPGGDMRLDE